MRAVGADGETGASASQAAAVGACSAAVALAAAGRSRMQRSRAQRKAEDGGDVKQLLGMKGASDDEETPLWKIRLQLCKPVTWPPLLFGVVAGTAASGNFSYSQDDWINLIICMMLSGPILVGYTQTLNDWYDREMDAINEPYRPIPSGRITEKEIWEQINFLGALGLSLAGLLDYRQGHWPPTVFITAAVGLLSAFFYSYHDNNSKAGLKGTWWIGCYMLGSSYIALPWWAGQSVFGEVSTEIIIFTLLYSFAGVGIAIVNDFKSVEGDKQLGLESAPVVLGIDTAKYLAPALKDITQLCVVGWLLYIGEWQYAAGLFVLILPQVFAATQFVKDPLGGDVKYQASSLPFFSIGTIVAASAVGANPYH
eukprot:TRINITY_DN7791_c0_g1_i1.p1 TRINITY_DN7791_c0_g1~~TRINITY_DN7791_c0_g1_i1.p1  ORF type:complete len:368 (+),score=77.79 TRINITY_DN7791_c0_g1_i1:210-1313(+)